jgi:signal transduction histidine kinase/CheY-like chemotaxis protein
VERRIVICAPTGRDAALTAKVLASVGIHSIVCAGNQALMEQLPLGAGALLLVEEVVSGGAMRPLADYVASQPTWSDIPILLLTRSGADSLDVQRAVEHLGNVTLVERPVRTIALITAAQSAIRARERQYQVRDADKRKDEFLATLAHELRNPLAPIRTSMGILMHLHPDSADVTRLCSVVDRQVSHLTRLVDDLLDVARITSGKVMLKRAPVALSSILNHAVEISGSGMEAKRHRLDVEKPEQDHMLDADQARVVQSVANLLVNAAKFTPAGGRIMLRAEVEGAVVTFRVRDNGIGLEPASLSGIFELFAQTVVPGEAPAGLGIGLSLARQFAEMHGGTLSAHSEGLGRGSEFVLTLPVLVEGAPTLVPAAAGQDARQRSLPKKVLVVDDNVDAADTLQSLLDMDGFTATVAYDGIAGLNGYDAARMIRRQPGSQHVTLIALTGWGQSNDRKRASEAGFDHHLVKPVDYNTLLKCLQA